MLPLEIIRMKAKGCSVDLSGNEPGFTLPSNIGELGDDIVNLGLPECSLQGITCRVAPTLRDGSESGISHTFPVPAMCTGPIPVELLRWKFVEGRKIELKGCDVTPPRRIFSLL